MKSTNSFLTAVALACGLFALNAAPAEARELAVKAGEKIAFMGIRLPRTEPGRTAL
jgi:hypothetical protein